MAEQPLQPLRRRLADARALVKRLRTDRLRSLGWVPTVDLEEGMRLTYEAMLQLGQVPARD